MSANLEQIDRDLESLRQAAQSLAQEGERSYQQYLKILGRAARQQMTLASYHICTQVYPDNFLQLSMSDRQQFQEKLQRLSQQTENALQDCWSMPVIELPSTDPTDLADPPDPALTGDQFVDWLPAGFWSTPPAPEGLPPGETLPESESSQISEALEFEAEHESSEPELPQLDFSVLPSVKEILAELKQAQANAEAQIAEILHKASKDLDQQLQAAKILPATPLEMVLEIAAKAEAAGRPVTRNPNLLTAMIDSEQEREHPPEAAVIAVYLQLGEIEFNDTTLMSERNQLRRFSAQLDKLDQQVQKKMRERQTILAAAAWRATWPKLS
jgi:hypothetical protein